MLYGRDVERAEIGALLDAARSSRGGALVVRGEAGVGKTALLEDTRDRAGDMHVLVVHGVESESELPFAGLHQLVRPALHLLDSLPSPQAVALRGALGLGDGPIGDRFLVYAGCLSLLSEMAARRPVLCLIDDAHWVDDVSADALLFVARRIDAEAIAMFFGAREGDIRSFEARDIPSLRLGGLDAEAVDMLLTHGAGRAAAPEVRDRIAALTGGNALALLEVPAALTEAQLAGVDPLPDALPLTQQVESVFLERVRRLPENSQRLLLVAAADDTGNLRIVTRAAEAFGVPATALAEVETAGLVSVNGTQLTFRHPLVRSAVYAAATSIDRRNAHRAITDALAEAGDQEDRRAWHLAASTLEHDEETVRALEGAAERAQARGGYLAAAKALARAAELSAEQAARGRRLVAAARSARIAGADSHAVELANEARALVDDPLLRSEIALALGAAAFRCGRPRDGVPTLLEAAREISSRDPARAVELLVWAMPCAVSGGEVVDLVEVSEVATSIVPREDERSLNMARALAVIAGAILGSDPEETDALDDAFAWALTRADPFDVWTIGVAALYAGAHERSEALLERAAGLARARGEFGVLAETLTMRAFQLALAQSFDGAAIAAEESSHFARELRAANLAVRCLSVLAYIAAIRGDEEAARRHARDVIEHAAGHGPSLGLAFALYALATVEMGQAHWPEALQHLEMLAETRRPGTLFVAGVSQPDLIEAAVHAGRTDIARSVLAELEVWAARPQAAWIRPRLASSRALLSDGAEASEHFEQALQLAAVARPFDLARIQLLYGEHLRRQRRRIDARVHLRAALEAFERFRAEPWAERARTELRASGEVARKRDPSTISQLTAQEIQVARLVAEGLSNKEAAAQLFLSPRTIDAHLRNVFAKLGLTSRTQLARVQLGGDEAPSVLGPALSPA